MTVLDYASGAQRKSYFLSRISNHWLSWAVYLGMSWTWCIGMFLPVLLIRDYAVWAWVIFAVPNVVGAAAMGWVLRDGKSEQLVAKHRWAVSAFSFVTATFQIFFAFWLFEGGGWVMVGVAACCLISMRRNPDASIYLCIGVLLVSSLCIGGYALEGQTFRISAYGTRFYPQLLPLLPVCIFGFGLCPYLDGTFHHARQRLPAKQARLMFSVGFGVFFLLMIIFTLVYAGNFFFDTNTVPNSLAVIIHLLVQLALTTSLHWQIRPMPVVRAIASVVIAVLLWWAAGFIHVNGIESGEVGYRLLMAFYGLVFPAYVWLCMIPTWRDPQTPGRRSLVIFAASVLLASPFYWLGFIEGKMIWLLPGLAIVLLARALVPWKLKAVVAYN